MSSGRTWKDQHRDGQNRFKPNPPARAFRLWAERGGKVEQPKPPKKPAAPDKS